MGFQRRNFIKVGAAGLTAGILHPSMMFAQASSVGKSEFEVGGGSVRLQGKLKSGMIRIDAHDFIEGRDRSITTHSKFNSANLYGATFSHNYDRTVFAMLSDDVHSTTLVLSDSDDPKVGRLSVWNDAEAPRTFKVDKVKAVDAQDLKESILEGKGGALDLVGKRKKPPFTWDELESVFGQDPALLKFMRGQRVSHHPLADQKPLQWACRIIGSIPGSVLGLMWLPETEAYSAAAKVPLGSGLARGIDETHVD